MRIAYIASGAAGMYCGTCIHDNTLAAALIKAGHDVTLLPTYTPTRTDETNVSINRVFLGAINVYLLQRFPLYRHLPAFIRSRLDNPRFLDWVAIKAGAASNEASDLGEMTLSVLRGADGVQRDEVATLVDWLADYRPDIVHLNLALFLGLAEPIKRRVGVPLVCGLTGEDLFIDELPSDYRAKVLAEMRARAHDVEAYLAPSRFYADMMSDYLQVEPERIRVTPLGIHADDFVGRPRRPESASSPLRIGYLARICPEKGLHVLVEAFKLLCSQGERPIELVVAGYLAGKNRTYLDSLKDDLKRSGLAEKVTFLGEVDRDQKIRLLSEIDILSVPTTYHEPKGLFVLEALANGVPVVQPSHGSFPELIQATGGGLLVEPNDSEGLARALAALLDDPQKRFELGRRGRAAVLRNFSAEVMAESTVRIYRDLIENGASSRSDAAERTRRLHNAT